MKRFSADLVSQEAFEMILYQDWQPLTWDIKREFNLDHSQVHSVKRNLKRMFGDIGIVWGYCPELNRFIMAPEHDCAQQRAVIDYATRHASSATYSIKYQIRGAEISNSITPESAELANKLIDRATTDIHDAGDAIQWVDKMVPETVEGITYGENV